MRLEQIMWKHKTTATLFCCLLLAGAPARAEVTQNELQIVGRVLSFFKRPLTGDVSVGIVYSADNAQSVREAESLQRLLGNGLKVGNVTLKPSLVKATDVARASVGLFFLMPGLGADAKPVAAASEAKHIPCITTDLAEVRSGACSMGVRSQPKIEILVNRGAADASHTEFSAVFRMMITEI